MNSNQKKLQQMIKDQTLSLTDEELFLSSAYQKYLSSMAKAATGRYRQGLQTLMEWDISSGADVAYTDNYKIHINAGNHITQSFPSRMLRSESLAGLNGHETAHLLFTDFTTLGLYLGSMDNGAFYPEPPSFDDQYQTGCEEMLEAMQEKDKAACLTLSRCASHISNILEDIYIETRMCEAFPGTFKQGIELNSMRMNELMPSLQSQIDKEYSDFSIMANLLLQYCRAGTVNNLHGYTGPYLDYLEDCVPYVEESLYSDDMKDRLHAANHILGILWEYIKPLIEDTREKLQNTSEDEAGQLLEGLLGSQIHAWSVPFVLFVCLFVWSGCFVFRKRRKSAEAGRRREGDAENKSTHRTASTGTPECHVKCTGCRERGGQPDPACQNVHGLRRE